MDFLFFRMFAVLSIVCACEFQFLLAIDEKEKKKYFFFQDSLKRNGMFGGDDDGVGVFKLDT